MKIGDTEKLIESGSDSICDSKIRYFCKADEMFDILEKAHTNVGHNGQEVIRLIERILTAVFFILWFLLAMHSGLYKNMISSQKKFITKFIIYIFYNLIKLTAVLFFFHLNQIKVNA